jgi:chemotaxis protein CheZ
MTGQSVANQPRRPFMAELQHLKRSGGAGPQPDAPPAAAAPAPAPAPVVDNSEVLRAIADLTAKFDRFVTTDQADIESIRIEIFDISGRIKATKAEMAALRHPLASEDKFQQASEELTAVVSATEGATNSIMAAAEEIDSIVQELRSQLPADGYQAGRVQDLAEQVTRIYEACNFQDLTGQRITKVVRALSFIEERVDAMMSVWNKKEFELMPLPPEVTKKDGDLELHGPNEANAEKGMISQSEIDALFG